MTGAVSVVVTSVGRVESTEGLLVVARRRRRRILGPVARFVRVVRRVDDDAERFGRRPRLPGSPCIVIAQFLGVVTYFTFFELAGRLGGSHDVVRNFGEPTGPPRRVLSANGSD